VHTPNQETMESKVSIVVKCILIFLLTVTIWHLYWFTVTLSAYKSYFMWGNPQGYLFYLLFYILMFTILVFFTRYIDHSPLKSLGLIKGTRWKSHIIIGVCFAFLARFLQIGFGVLIGGVLVLDTYPSLFVMSFFIVDTFFVGLSEEGVFRGYIQRRLTNAWKFLPALLITSSLFHIYHKNFFTTSINDLVSASLAITPSFGIFAGYLYYKSRGKLLAPIALHMFYDLFGTIVPFGIDTTEVQSILFSASNILLWSMLIIILRLVADKTSIFRSDAG